MLAGQFSWAGACDSHVHVFGPPERFAYVENRRYTPPTALLDDYRVVMAALGLDRAVLSAPSVHGLDNSALLHALMPGDENLRGVIMIPANVEESRLEQMHAAGVRAVRTQLKPSADKPLTITELRSVAALIAPLGWHVEIHVDVGVVTDIAAQCENFPAPVVIEHMGHMPVQRGLDAPGFQSLLTLLREGGWVKLSGAYLISGQPPPHEDVRPFVDALLDAAPQRCVWATNWPHPHQAPSPNEGEWSATFRRWVGDEELLRKVLVDNPGQLYDFAPIDSDSQDRKDFRHS